MPKSNYDLACQRIAEDLGLPPPSRYSQIWEREVTVEGDFDHFFDYLTSTNRSPLEKKITMSLVISFLEDCIGSGKPIEIPWARVAEELATDPQLYDEIVQYWALADTPDPAEWFAITPFLRRALTDKSAK